MRQQLSFALFLLAACAPPHAAPVHLVRVTAPITIDAPSVIETHIAGSTIRAARNLFAFVEPPPARPVVAVTTVAQIVRPPVVETTPMTSAVVVPPTPPTFTGSCIGRFGPDDDPLAAFVIDGAVVNARRGESIGKSFLVRAIGIESVDLEPAGFPGALQRVAIGQARR